MVKQQFKQFINTIVSTVKVNSFLKGVLSISFGAAAGQLIVILTTPFVTRIYTPSDYGIYTSFFAVFKVIAPLATLRYAVAIPLADSKQMTNNLINLCIFISLGLSLFLTVGLFFGQEIILSYYIKIEVTKYLWILPLFLFGKGISETLNYWVLRTQNYSLITKTKFYSASSGAAAKIGFGIAGFKPVGLIIAIFVQQIAIIVTILSKLLKSEYYFRGKLKFYEIRSVAKKFKNFPLYQSWAKLLLGLSEQLPVFFLTFIYGFKVLGYYGLAKSIINIPISLIGNSVGQVFYAEASKIGKGNPKRLYELTKKVYFKLAYISFVPVLFVFILGPWLFSVLFGQEWYMSGIYARWLIIVTLTRFVSSPITRILNVLELQKTQLIINIFRVLFISVIFIYIKQVGLEALEAIKIYSILLTIIHLIIPVIVFKKLKKVSRAHK